MLEQTKHQQHSQPLKTLMEKQKRKRGDEGVKVLSISTTPSYFSYTPSVIEHNI